MGVLNKSIRLTAEDARGIQDMIQRDPRIEKGQSEALYYAFKDAAENIPDWNIVANAKFDDTGIEMDPDSGYTKSFSVDEQDFATVVESLKSQLNIQKVRISYMTRLCIMASRMRLNEISEKDVQKKGGRKVSIKIEGVSLIRQIAELLETDNDEARDKIIRIKNIVEGKS